jgi:hypothetical protein
LSCKHAYHSWCAITHFSSKHACIKAGCDQEPHPEWWKLSGIEKPVIKEDGDLEELGGLQYLQEGKFPSFILIYVVFLFNFGFIIMHFKVWYVCNY